jgi:hypothetical protein
VAPEERTAWKETGEKVRFLFLSLLRLASRRMESAASSLTASVVASSAILLEVGDEAEGFDGESDCKKLG